MASDTHPQILGAEQLSPQPAPSALGPLIVPRLRRTRLVPRLRRSVGEAGGEVVTNKPNATPTQPYAHGKEGELGRGARLPFPTGPWVWREWCSEGRGKENEEEEEVNE